MRNVIGIENDWVLMFERRVESGGCWTCLAQGSEEDDLS